jgi:hypothetical protein
MHIVRLIQMEESKQTSTPQRKRLAILHMWLVSETIVGKR